MKQLLLFLIVGYTLYSLMKAKRNVQGAHLPAILLPELPGVLRVQPQLQPEDITLLQLLQDMFIIFRSVLLMVEMPLGIRRLQF
jgi:hypothetical protein